MAKKKLETKQPDCTHEYQLLGIVNQMRTANVGHYECARCGSHIVRPRGNDTTSETIVNPPSQGGHQGGYHDRK